MLSERLLLPEVTLTIDDRGELSLTSVGGTSGPVLGVSTTVPDRDLELVSCYLHEPGGAIGASHLALASWSADEGSYRLIAADEVAGADPGWCVLDHAAHLCDLLADAFAARVEVDVPPEALERLAGSWPSRLAPS